MTLSNAEDDGEDGAGRRLLELLRDKDVNNYLIRVSEWYGGSDTGPGRLNDIVDAGKRILELQHKNIPTN